MFTSEDRLQVYMVATPAGPLQIVAVPWPRRGGILSREETRGLSIEESAGGNRAAADGGD